MAEVHISHAQIERILNDVLEKAARELKVLLLPELRQRAPKDTGELANSISIDVGRPLHGRLTITVNYGAEHAVFVIQGTQGPYRSIPPFGTGTRLGGWAHRKGLPAGPVAHVLSQQGTQPNNAWIEEAVAESLRRIDI